MFCILYGSQDKQELLPYTALTDCFRIILVEAVYCAVRNEGLYTRVGTLIVATIYLQLIQNRYMIRSFTVLQCSHQYCVQPVANDVEVVEYI